MGWSKKHCLIGIFVLLAVCQLPAAGRAALVAHWTFDEAPGATQVVDTVVGLVGNLSPAGAALVGDGKAGGALSLVKGTTGGYVNMGDVLNLGTGPYSFVTWVKTTTLENDSIVMAKHSSGVVAGYLIGVNDGNTYGSPNKAWFYNVSPGASPFSTTSVNDGQWHQIVGVRGNGLVRIYVDGLPVENSQIDQGLNNPPAGTPFLVGGISSGGNPVAYYTGLVDDIQVYNHALSDTEVQWLFEHPGQPLCTAAPPGMVSWWGGDNNALDLAGMNPGTLQGSVTYAVGKVGQAFSFDGGENNFVEIPNSYSLTAGGAFSVDGWFYIDPTVTGNAGEIATFVSKSQGSIGYGWSLYFDDRGASKSLKFVVGSVVEFPNAIPTPNWYHIAGVYDPAAIPRTTLYLNGIPVADSGGATGGITSDDLNVRIGAMYWTDVYHEGNDRLNGKADEVELFNRALSDNEILAIYNAGSAGKCRACAAPPAGLVSWWKGEGDAVDLLGLNHGTLVGDTTFTTGKVGQAFAFDGAGDYINVPDHPSLNPTTAITVDAWIYSDNSSYAPPIVKKTDNSSGYALELSTDSNQVLFWVNLGSGGSGGWFSSPAGSLTRGVWTHVAGVFDGSTVGLYMNSQFIGANSAQGTIIPSTSPLNIGRDPSNPDRFFKGLIDEVEIHNRALSASEIAAIYNAGSAGMCPACTQPPADMLAWWKAEGNAADNLGTNHGTLSGTAFASGRVGEAFSLDGFDDYVVIPNGIVSATARSFSLDAWVYANSLDGNEHVVVYGGAAAGEYLLMIDGNNDFRFGIKLDDGNWYTATSPAVANAWAHLAGVRRGSSIELWVNGALVANTAVADRDLYATGNNMNNSRLGAYNEFTDQHKSHWSGLIDEVTFFNRALSGDEITVACSAGGLGRCFTAQTTPQAFTFAAATDVEPNTPIASNTIQIDGINSPAAIAIVSCTGSACQYRINGGDWLSEAGTVLKGDTVTVRQISSAVFNTQTDLYLTIGGVSEPFRVTTRAQAADLSIVKTSTPATPVLGQPLTYTLTVSNAGPDTAEQVTVTDVLPAGLTFDSASAPCSYENANRTVACSLGSLSNGAQRSVDIEVISNVSGPVSNTARVASSISDPGGGNNSSTREVSVEVHLFLPLIIKNL